MVIRVGRPNAAIMSNLESALFSVLVVVGVTFVIYFKWAFTYWKKRNLLCVEEPTIPFGNALLGLREKMIFAFITKRTHDTIKHKGYKHAGGFLLTVPFYTTVDPNQIKLILQQDFEKFSQRLYDNFDTDEPIASNLAFVSGERWRSLRSKLTPAFTPGKLKLMLDAMIEGAYRMQEELDSGNKEAVKVKHVAERYFADVIANCAYGFKNADPILINHANKLIDFRSKYRLFKLFMKIMFPKISWWLGISFFDKTSTEFFVNLAKETVKFRKSNNVVRKDLFQFLLESETELNVDEMDDEASNSSKIIKDMASQVFLFFIAGYETSTVTFGYCLFELSQNSTIQDKLRNEVDTVLLKYGGKITYDAIMDMKYMAQVVDETMRKYPPVPFITRRCTKDTKIDEAIIEKGVLTFISVIGLHHDPDYYPDPEKFEPERFSEENKQKRPPFTYLPFGEGPRNCPAYRLGLMQIKVGLVVVLQQYTVSLNKKTPLPIKIDSGIILLVPKTEILLDINRRNGRK